LVHRSSRGAVGSVALLIMVAMALSGSLGGAPELAAWMAEGQARSSVAETRPVQAPTLRQTREARRQEQKPVPSLAANALRSTRGGGLTSGLRAMEPRGWLLRESLLSLPPPALEA
jgi:hypothetical protein